MVATVTVVEATDAGPNWNTITNCRFNTSDEHDPVLTYPIPIPAAGFNYSYWKSVALNLADTFTRINNVRHYCDGAISWGLGTGGAVNRGNTGIADGSYVQSTGTPGTTGTEVVTGHSGIASVSAITSDTSGSPFTVDSANHDSAERTNHIVMQVKVADDATRGTKDAETFTWLYDEI